MVRHEVNGPFQPGAIMRGVMSPTTVNAEVAKAQKPYEGMRSNHHRDGTRAPLLIPMASGPIDPNIDYSAEPTTLIVFRIEDDADGVKLTVTETGFDQIPLERR